MEKVKLGIIGMSEGNGHPYSWSAIFNGYNDKFIDKCLFPVIPKYLKEQDYPEDFLTEKGEVTHIYTQDFTLSKMISNFSNIKNILDNPCKMIGKVDAILLATDDGENHYKAAKPFIEAGLPIYIDKPLALSLKDANRIFELQKYPSQVFTCSALRFSNELIISHSERESLGDIIHVEATIPKKWDKYAIHLIEPIVSQIPLRGKLLQVKGVKKQEFQHCLIEWENTTAYIKTTGSFNSSIKFVYYGNNNTRLTKKFTDSFSCFKKTLDIFIESIDNKNNKVIEEKETLEIIEIIEKAIQ